MAVANISAELNTSVEKAFDHLTDHANMSAWNDMVEQSFLDQEGQDTPNGKGAIRRLWFMKGWMSEEIIAWHPPGAGSEIGYDYTVVKGGPPIAKHLGEFRLTRTGDNTCKVNWKIHLKCPLWATGEIAAYFSCRSMEKKLTASIVNNVKL
ncbi:MAG: SRPBCC family protein [Granulosicoccaceae bacterium]